MPYVQDPANPEFSIKAMHLFATIGALTARGGRVTDATSSVKIAGPTIARALATSLHTKTAVKRSLRTAPALPRSLATSRLRWSEAT